MDATEPFYPFHDALMDAAPDAVIAIDAAGRVRAINRAGEALFGYPGVGMAGRPLSDFILPPRQGAQFKAEIVRRLATTPDASAHPVERMALHADGRELPVEVRMTDADTTQGESNVWIRDLSERKTREEEWVRRTAQLQRAEQIASIGSITWDRSTDRWEWSENLFRLLGLAPVATAPPIDLLMERIHPDDRERFAGGRETVRNGDLIPMEFRLAGSDGAIRHLRATFVEDDLAGMPGRIVGAVEDVTDERRAKRAAAAHMAVADAFVAGRPLEEAAGRLLRDLGGALEFTAASFWVRDRHSLTARTAWTDQGDRADEFAKLLRGLRVPRGAGLAGMAWERRQLVAMSRGPYDVSSALRRAAELCRLQGAVAIPAMAGDQVLAVVELYSRRALELDDNVSRSLFRLGHDVGAFLALRRGELTPTRLTRRELEVLRLAAEGLSTKSIAEKLVVSPSTVKTHLEHLYAKLRVCDRAAAVAVALRQGLID
jgi:PAS domain S-box-containing protein